MGEYSPACSSAPEGEGSCLELYQTIAILVALIVLVELALRLAGLPTDPSVFPSACSEHNLCPDQAAELETTPGAMAPALQAPPAQLPSRQPSERDVPRWRRRRREERSRSLPRRCLRCTLEPVHLTMNVQNEPPPPPCKEPPRVGRRPWPEPPPCHHHHPHLLRCCHPCECETRCRPRTASAPSGYAPVLRYRDVAVGSSEPMLSPVGSHDRRNHDVAVATEYYPRAPVGETHYRLVGAGSEADYPDGPTARSRRPTKVYIYPVHPQTPPGSRSASPERIHRRRAALTSSQEEAPGEFEPREAPRKAREPEPPAGRGGRFRTVATSVLQRAAQQVEGSGAKTARTWPESPAGSDWVYHPVK
ncbi:hypothetical protein JRQ81_004546 [Phrynocephalus forsythii]|uniref:Uncharacterized protein n=1 Tax=Phrynocephalus forsythii TaxID=171643 RepID=A0A9Q0XFC8_9SAUR|nr:hypothetical protein JRQ81_004546 [Phrynocephalus forsythii]